ncbi:LppU/SCO3897 family protein [Micromonospora sp. BQ11]|uniref:LppU/SCO3897 family protein n=1 Tax=Micromonospora sp. BQ11 TaxID=3452212 RepID=UPI003F8ABF03
MTSEGTHHPGQEPDEVSPGAGGPAPYGDRPAQQDNGYGTPDLGWAPPPPARPTPAAPAWAAHDNQPAAPSWGAAQVPQQAEANAPGSWNQGNGGQPWPTPAEQPARPAGEPDQPAWAQAGPAAVRGAAQVPQAAAWPAQDSPVQSGWANDQQDPAQSGGWANGAPAQDPAQSGGWANDAPAQGDRPQQPDWAAQEDPARSGGWQQQTAWPTPDQASPAWGQSEQAAARGAAQVPAAPPTPPPWPSQDDAGRSGGWTGEAAQEPAQAGGWANGAPGQDPAQAGGWAGQQDQAQAGGWSPNQQDQGHSGGWAAGGPPQHDRPQQPAWATQDDSARSGGWAAKPHDDRPQQPDWAAQGEGWDGGAEQPAAGRASAPVEQSQGEWAARAASGMASVPAPADDRDGPGWGSPESAATPPARASASVPGDGGPPAWAPAGSLPQRNGPDRESTPDVKPWSASEAWGHSDPAEQANSRSGDGWEQSRGEESPIYQPGPAPGISPANAVPLPPQEQRVPGASLAAAPPADYAPPAQYAPVSGQPAHADPSGREGGASAYEPEQHWGHAASRHEEPQSPAGPVVPAPRTSPESAGRASVPAGAGGEGGSISASASVPLASRVMPPTDQALRPGAAPAPQPRVYGRPARPEPAEEPSHDEGAPPPSRFGAAPENRFDQGPENRFDQGPENRFDQGPDNRFDQGPENRFDQGPDNRFDQGPENRFDQGPDNRFDQGPENRFDQGPDNRFDQGPENRFDQGPDNRFDHGPDQRFGPGHDNRDRPATAAFAAAPVAPASPAAPPAFPPGMPAFADAPATDRPVNGVRPQSGAERPAERFGAPTSGAASVNGSGFGPGPGDPARGGAYPPAFPPPPQPSEPSWDQGASEQDQGRFDAFKPIAEPAAEAPVPKVRNGRVLAAVLVAAVLILAVPLGLLTLLGMVGDSEKAPGFDPAVGSCVKQSGNGATAVDCAEAGAYSVVSKVDAKEKCADPSQPHVVLPGEGTNRVLCLKPAAG